MVSVIIIVGWIVFIFGSAANFRAWKRGLQAKAGERLPSGIPIVPGIAGAIAVFFTLPLLAQRGFHAPWPRVWIVLPLFLDVYCLGGLMLALVGFARSSDST